VSPAKAAAPQAQTHLRVTQVRSEIGTKPKHRATLRALGLRGRGRSRVLADSETLRGMISRVSHLVAVEPSSEGELRRPPRRSEVVARREAAPRQARPARERAGSAAAGTGEEAPARKAARTRTAKKVASSSEEGSE
jgi:large subunit ribosomal protein L30